MIIDIFDYMTKREEKAEALDMWIKGEPTHKIEKTLGIAHSTLYNWTRNVARDEKKVKENRIAAIREGTRRRRERIFAEKCEIANRMSKDFCPDKDSVVAALYMGEGTKHIDIQKGEFSFCNSNPKYVKFMADWLLDNNIKSEDIKLCIWYHEGPDPQDITQYWEKKIGLKAKVYSKGYGGKNKRIPYGTARIRVVNNTYLYTLFKKMEDKILK